MKAFKTLSMALALILVTLTIPFGAFAAIADADVASIGDVGYADLTEALQKAQEGEEVVVLKDASINFTTLGVLEKSITISAKEGLQAKPVITCNGKSGGRYLFQLASGKTLQVKGLSLSSSVASIFCVTSNSTYELTNVDVTATFWYCIDVVSAAGGTVIINGGSYTGTYSAIYIDKTSDGSSAFNLTVGGGAVVKQISNPNGNAPIYNDGRPNVNVTVNDDKTLIKTELGNAPIYNAGNNFKLTINDGELVAKNVYGIRDTGMNSLINICGGQVTGLTGSYTICMDNTSNNSVLNISGGEITAGTSHALYIKGNTAVNISGGTIISGDASATLNLATTGKVTITGGTINAVNYGDGDDLFGNQYVQYKAEDAGTTDLRLLTNVTLADTGAYTEMGYFVSLSAKQIVADTAKVVNTSKKVLYTSVKAGEAYIEAGEENVYWLAVELADIPEADYGTTIYVRPYAKTEAGTYVLGDMASFTVNAVVNPTVE